VSAMQTHLMRVQDRYHKVVAAPCSTLLYVPLEILTVGQISVGDAAHIHAMGYLIVDHPI